MKLKTPKADCTQASMVDGKGWPLGRVAWQFMQEIV